MPTRGKPRHAFRFDRDLWAAFVEAVRRDPLGRTPTDVIRDHVRWYVHERGIPRPQRPPRERP